MPNKTAEVAIEITEMDGCKYPTLPSPKSTPKIVGIIKNIGVIILR